MRSAPTRSRRGAGLHGAPECARALALPLPLARPAHRGARGSSARDADRAPAACIVAAGRGMRHVARRGAAAEDEAAAGPRRARPRAAARSHPAQQGAGREHRDGGWRASHRGREGGRQAALSPASPRPAQIPRSWLLSGAAGCGQARTVGQSAKRTGRLSEHRKAVCAVARGAMMALGRIQLHASITGQGEEWLAWRLTVRPGCSPSMSSMCHRHSGSARAVSTSARQLQPSASRSFGSSDEVISSCRSSASNSIEIPS